MVLPSMKSKRSRCCLGRPIHLMTELHSNCPRYLRPRVLCRSRQFELKEQNVTMNPCSFPAKRVQKVRGFFFDKVLHSTLWNHSLSTLASELFRGGGGGSPHHPKYRKYKCASESKSYLQGGGPHQSLLQTHTPLPQGNKGFHPDNFALVSACEQIWTSNFQPLPRPPEVAYLGQHEGA